MWYPFKFWRNVGYAYLCGDLAVLFGQGQRHYGHRFRRAVETAKRRDPDFELAVPGDDWAYVAIEGWTTTPDRVFSSLTTHYINGSGIDLWVQTSPRSHGGYVLLDQAHGGAHLFEGASTSFDGRVVGVAYLPGTLPEPPPIVRLRRLTEFL